jgi:hypothetical protein
MPPRGRREQLLTAPPQLGLEQNPWTCDCRLRALREWLGRQSQTVTTAPEPACQSPAVLAGAAIQSVALAALACRPTIRPASLHLTAEQGRAVTLHCSVDSEPPPTVTWSFQGSLLSAGEVAERPEGPGRLQSSLTLRRVDARWAGTFFCRATNPAGVAEARYRLTVVAPAGGELQQGPPPLQLHYFVLVAAGSLVFLVLTSISLSLGILLLCRRRIKRR